MRAREEKTCFYCGALVANGGEDDHFPVPAAAGGEITVPCCISCHDMKDRFPLGTWPPDWIQKVIDDLPKFSRETRLFFAKAIRLLYETNGMIEK